MAFPTSLSGGLILIGFVACALFFSRFGLFSAKSVEVSSVQMVYQGSRAPGFASSVHRSSSLEDYNLITHRLLENAGSNVSSSPPVLKKSDFNGHEILFVFTDLPVANARASGFTASYKGDRAEVKFIARGPGPGIAQNVSSSKNVAYFILKVPTLPSSVKTITYRVNEQHDY